MLPKWVYTWYMPGNGAQLGQTGISWVYTWHFFHIRHIPGIFATFSHFCQVPSRPNLGKLPICTQNGYIPGICLEMGPNWPKQAFLGYIPGISFILAWPRHIPGIFAASCHFLWPNMCPSGIFQVFFAHQVYTGYFWGIFLLIGTAHPKPGHTGIYRALKKNA